MSLLTIEKSLIYDSMCMNLFNDKQILFACIVNSKGRVVPGSSELLPDCFENEKDFEMFLMEIALEFSMKREFDNKLGRVEYTFSKRNGGNVMCIPIHDNVLVIISRGNVSPQDFIKKCMHVLEPNLVI